MQTAEPTRTVKFLSAFRELFNEHWRNIVFYGGRSSGKSHSVALALLLRGRQKRLRILCTREIQNTIKDSVHKLLSDLVEQHGFTDYVVQKDSIINVLNGTEFIFKGLRRNITEIKSTEGVDICWIEEAQSVTKESIDIITPTIRKDGSQIIITFNRFTELDPVYVHFVQHQSGKTFVGRRNYDILESAGLLPDVIKEEIELDKPYPSLFAHKWLGEPVSQSDASILNRDNVLNAMRRDIAGDGQTVIGVDVARMGDDKTVFWKRKGLKTTATKRFTKLRTTEICDQLERFAETKVKPENGTEEDISRKVQIQIDDTGVGGGVTDEMLKRGYNVIPINFGAKAKDDDKYPNLISEAWFEFDAILPEAQLPMESDLLMELTTRQWGQDTKGKRRIESKGEYKKRGFSSPDDADACIICYYVPKQRHTRTFASKPSGF